MTLPLPLLELGHRLRRYRCLAADARGMTLLEILIVMVILGLLATLGSVQLTSYLGRARTDTARLQMQELATALDLYRLDVGRIPTTAEGLQALVEQPAGVERWRGPYLRHANVLNDPWGRPYQYQVPGDRREFDLVSLGADGQPGGERENADVSIWQER